MNLEKREPKKRKGDEVPSTTQIEAEAAIKLDEEVEMEKYDKERRDDRDARWD